MTARILHIEDNPGDRLLMRRRVESSERGWSIESVATLAEGLTVSHADIALLDLGLPDSQGLETLARLRAARPSMPIVVLTGQGEALVALQALREGADDFLSKDSLTTAALLRSVDHSLERRRLRVELEQSKQNFAAIVQATTDPIWVVDERGQTLFSNAAALALRGLGDTNWGPNPDQESVHAFGERSLQLRVSPTLWFGSPCTLVMAYDVTAILERKAEAARLQRALDLTQRRQDLERLAAGLAHSINNSLVGVLSVAARVDRVYAAELTEATRRIRGITHLMGTFSDDQARTAAPNNLQEALRKAHVELQARAGDRIALQCTLEHQVHGATFSKEYLRPILWALMDNALLAGSVQAWLRARVEGGFAVVEWESQCQRIGTPDREPVSWEDLRSNPGALALTASHAFALSAGGRAELWHSPKRHTDVLLRLYLPLTTLGAKKLPRPRQDKPVVATKGAPGGLAVLVVDDDNLVRRVICSALRKRGHQVFEAADGREGLKTAQSVPLDIIVCDVRMPHMDGPTMVRMLRDAGSTTPILMTSGYSEIELPEGEQIGMLGKPFLPADLDAAISALIDS